MPYHRPSQPLSGGRLAAVIAGALIGLLASLLADRRRRPLLGRRQEGRRRLLLDRTRALRHATTAIASDDLDVNGVPLGENRYGKVRLKVSSRDGKPVFAGIARTSDVDAYLAGTAHATLTDVDFSPSRPATAPTPGTRTPARPPRPGLLGRLRRGHRHADARPGRSRTATGRSC